MLHALKKIGYWLLEKELPHTRPMAVPNALSDAERLARKRQAAIATLGSRYVLHPSNQQSTLNF
mgnify:CR=1 FL=1